MARKAATRTRNSALRADSSGAAARTSRAERSGAPSTATATLEAGLLAALVLAIALGGTILWVHEQLAATRGTYTSFCNVSSRINCDAVLTSAYGMLLGVPVALWAVLTYAALVALVAVRRRMAGERRARATLLLLGLAVWSAVFSLYMAGVATFAIGAVCLLCSGLYVLNLLIALLAWRIARAEGLGGDAVLTRRRLALGGAAVAAALVVVGTWQLAATSATAHLTAADVEAQNPEFYHWYSTRPVVGTLPPAFHVRGADDAPITIVEFSDFECAYCGKAFRDVRDVERRHGNVRVVFHHFPLDPDCNAHVPSPVHQSACQAAIAAECAARFGRFWEYHDRLFGNQERLGRDDLIATAVDLGIDRDAFTTCLADPAARQRVVADADAGARLGVKSTPTLFINGRVVEGALDRPAYEWVLAMERRG